MKTKSGTAARTSSFISPMAWKYIRGKTTSPSQKKPKNTARMIRVKAMGKPTNMPKMRVTSITSPAISPLITTYLA